MLGSLEGTSVIGFGAKFLDPWQIEIGANSVLNAESIVDGRGGGVRIGAHVDIGTQTHIWTLEHDPNDPSHSTRGSAVVIESHVWIASRVTILPGVTIGKGAVVACGSVVTKNVGPKQIVAGVPARVIGQRENPLEYELNYNPRYL